ncbi:hypothetical protein LT85_4033 [Collimonas arenae]|uniref:Uncharacterized protein n=1 Tax=Collimonas arenae TaxID=279058 RepID=A0A0A1FFA0_9BURK|nr:hypothetical protein LT85_4033 [Collimonas arenae]
MPPSHVAAGQLLFKCGSFLLVRHRWNLADAGNSWNCRKDRK